MIHSPSFKDLACAAAFERFGFTTAPLLTARDVATLRDVALRAMARARPGFFTSVLQDPAQRSAAHEAIAAVLTPALRPVLDEARLVLASLIGRTPGSGADDLPMHQDWTFVDETRARSISVWVPLQAVQPDNGCMFVIPGSHHHTQPARRIGAGFRYAAMEQELRAHRHDVPLRAGEAVFFDHRLIHGSHANRSTAPRLAVGAVLLPQDQPLHMGVGAAFADRDDAFLLTADLAALASGRSPVADKDHAQKRREHA